MSVQDHIEQLKKVALHHHRTLMALIAAVESLQEWAREVDPLKEAVELAQQNVKILETEVDFILSER